MAEDYATLADLRDWFRLNEDADPSDTVDDADMTRALSAASRRIDHLCSRSFYQVPEARTFAAHDAYKVKLGPPFNDLVSVTEIATDDGTGQFATVWAATDYQLLTKDGSPNANAGPEARPFEQVVAVGDHTFPTPGRRGRRDLVRITGTWGWPTIPASVVEACLILAAEGVKLRDMPFGVAGFGEFGAVRVRDNPKALQDLADYIPFPGA